MPAPTLHPIAVHAQLVKLASWVPLRSRVRMFRLNRWFV